MFGLEVIMAAATAAASSAAPGAFPDRKPEPEVIKEEGITLGDAVLGYILFDAINGD
jgi:hypothetical protein